MDDNQRSDETPEQNEDPAVAAGGEAAASGQPTADPGRAQQLNIPPRPAPPTGYGVNPAAPSQTPPSAAFGAQNAYQAHAGGQPTAENGHHAGAAFGATQPTQPLPRDGEQPGWAPAPVAEKKRTGAGKVAAAVLVAALVGGAAGFGGSWAWSSLSGGTSIASSSGTSPSNITVNNPGSVNEATAIATEVLPSVVTIDVAGASSSGSGSGVVLSDDGYVVTNTHVVTLGGTESDATIRVTTSDGHIYDATVVGTDPTYDLAVIKLEGASDLTPIDFADSSQLNVGATTVAVGAPLGLANTVTTGIVSALNRSIEIASSAAPEGDSTEDDDQGDSSSPWYFDIPGQEEQQSQATESIAISVIQTDAAINPGNSGGALVDSEGKLIGLNVAIATADSTSEESGSIGVGFAIPSNIVERVANEIVETGSATHGLLGASVQPSSQIEGATITGAYIAEVVGGGAAAEAGLQEGDIVTAFDGAPVSDAVDLTAQVRAAAAGSDATITYVRDGEEYTADVTLGTLE
ncbi:trypsin-like peptidase domain-containing protein [Microbacterium betulae]|uniref:Trypsin-like peptidase domain-containing protein n=1 Tax=Microbacterium betulae TaxID=2981139 RepID=A0AA97I654_9MICO|nr:trypsin-like peptidase domain-containing protein [Microbacterium sp. AB]WOF24466.1 trypsin-like peptidase domain-containing protein [Microbacterium sp. AB]